MELDDVYKLEISMWEAAKNRDSTVLVGTLAEDGSTSLESYSLVQPYYIVGKDYYAMLLCCRNSSKTAQHLLARGKWSDYYFGVVDQTVNMDETPNFLSVAW